ncbi:MULTISPECIES: hypothetical protein [unclassified Microcoleus]|uniref:hypothetical protein n=1 Tax=unclassified Microcoleus TaxID=2642155 RepID=UPI002FCF3B07
MQNRSNNHSTDKSIRVGQADSSAIVSGRVNGNITISSTSTHQSGNFGVGANNGTIRTDKLAGIINEAPSHSPGKQNEVSRVPKIKVLLDAVDHAQRFMFGWQFFAVIFGLLMAIIAGVGTQIDFDGLLAKQKEQTTQQKLEPTAPELK